MKYDVIVAGVGPAGAACAAVCASSGLRVLVLDRAKFPRDKVCGDCLNPACWPILERLGAADAVRHLPHARLREVVLAAPGRKQVKISLAGTDGPGEIGVRRYLLDELLLKTARDAGAEIREHAAITGISDRWKVRVGGETFEAPMLVAADGRNSIVARTLGLIGPPASQRVAIQSHCPLPPGWRERILLQLTPGGYAGLADIGGGLGNLCLVSRPAQLSRLKAWAVREFDLPQTTQWMAITPLSRRSIAPSHPGLYLVGDAARVVEPFTGEGIFYAMASGELAGRHIAQNRPWQEYRKEHAALYRGRLWVNRLARLAVSQQPVGSAIFGLLGEFPHLASLLTSKVVGKKREPAR